MTIEEKNIRTEDRYNMDETGFAIGSVKDSYVVVNKASNTRYQTHSDRQEWTSVMECICADGESIAPFIILKERESNDLLDSKISIGIELAFRC